MYQPQGAYGPPPPTYASPPPTYYAPPPPTYAQPPPITYAPPPPTYAQPPPTYAPPRRRRRRVKENKENENNENKVMRKLTGINKAVNHSVEVHTNIVKELSKLNKLLTEIKFTKENEKQAPNLIQMGNDVFRQLEMDYSASVLLID